MRKLLVPTDFSDTAGKALQYAAEIAQRSGARIYLLHISSPVESPFIDAGLREQTNSEEGEKIKSSLAKLREQILKDFPKVEIQTVRRPNPLVDGILDFATEEAVDLIIMGTQGATGLRKIIIGSNAVEVLEETPIPLLLVPEKCECVLPSRIVLAANYETDDLDALRFIKQIADLFQSEVQLVNLLEAENANVGAEESEFKNYVSGLEEKTGLANLKTTQITCQSVNETFACLDSQVPYDLLVMVRRRRGALQSFFTGSATERMAFITTLPMLIFPADE